MLHNVDNLLRDIQRTLKNFEVREKALASREAYVQGLESKLQELMATVQEHATAVTKSLPSECHVPPVATPDETLSKSCDARTPEAIVHQEVIQLQELITVDTKVNATDSHNTAKMEGLSKPLPSMMSAARNQRKKRRR